MYAVRRLLYRALLLCHSLPLGVLSAPDSAASASSAVNFPAHSIETSRDIFLQRINSELAERRSQSPRLNQRQQALNIIPPTTSHATTMTYEHDALITTFTHEAHRPRADSALTMLRKVASLVKPIMRQRGWRVDRKSTRLNSSHSGETRMPSSA